MGKIVNFSAVTKQYSTRVARRNITAREKFENEWHRKRAFLPTLLSSNRWIWGKVYWVRYRAIVDVEYRLSSYMNPKFVKGRKIERLNTEELIIRKLKEC
jgi:hypothetical protein